MRLLHATSVSTPIVTCLICCVAADIAEDCAGNFKRLQGGASLLQISAGKASLDKHQSNQLTNEDLGREGLQEIPDNNLERGLHRVVGKDGVFMISLPRGGERANYSKKKLSEVGIDARIYTGTDGRSTSVTQEVLDKVIDFHTPMNDSWYKTAAGYNESRWAASLGDSHMRAWQEAQRRQENWTAILEDDVIPIVAENMTGTEWLEAFEAAWDKVPPTAKLVRMGYCWAPGLKRNIIANVGRFMVTTMGPTPGICTTGYLVHKDAIPDLLPMFPCPITLDVCLAMHLVSYPEGSSISVADRIGLANIERTFEVDEEERIFQYGILKQDWSALPTHYGNATYFASLVDALVALT